MIDKSWFVDKFDNTNTMVVFRTRIPIKELNQMPKGKGGYSKHNPKASKMMDRNKAKPVKYINNNKGSINGGKKK